MEVPNHLGGHLNKTHLDHGVLEYLISNYPIKTMADVGAGPGGMVQLAKEYGLEAYSIDGDWTVEPDVLHDYQDGPLVVDPVDLIWCVEFLEHVNEEYLPNYMETLKCAKYVFCTASTTTGHHHVNCQPRPYWVDKFEEAGFEYQAEESEKIRTTVTTMNIERPLGKQFVKLTGMFYINQNWGNTENSS